MATIIPPEELLRLYAAGWFPMAMEDGSLRCFSPDPRGIIPLEGFHIPHGARRTLRDPLWEVRVDTAFSEVMQACAEREDTWIDDTITRSYGELHRLGHAHSVEVWREGATGRGAVWGENRGCVFRRIHVSHCSRGFQGRAGEPGRAPKERRIFPAGYAVDHSAS